MFTRALIGAGCALVLASCSSPPKPPTVDDSKKRPVNVSEAVNLQMCRTELSAAKIVLNETLVSQAPATHVLAMPAALPASKTGRIEANQVFVINFPVGSAALNLAAEEKAQLLEQARGARLIVIRGRTDAPTDSMAETRLAKRRAEAAYSYLASQVRLPPDGIRLSWQGAGDPLRPGELAPNDHANRRVEIEMYQVKPAVHVLSSASS